MDHRNARAIAEFIAAPHQTPHAELQSHQLTGRTDTASFRLRGHERMRAFAFEEGGPIVLGLPKTRIVWHPSSVFTKLGDDDAALLSDCPAITCFLISASGANSAAPASAQTMRPSFRSWRSSKANRGRRSWRPQARGSSPKALSAWSNRLLHGSKSTRSSRFPMRALLKERIPISYRRSWRRERKSVQAWRFPIYAAPVAIFYPSQMSGECG